MKVKAYPAWRTALVLGVVPKVNGRCETELQKLVEQEPRDAGYSFSTWTCADLLHELIRKGFQAVSCETIRVHLHALGYRVRRPVLSIASPDPEYKQKAKKLERYKKQAKNGEVLLHYQDEIDLNVLPGIMRCWCLDGDQHKVDRTECRRIVARLHLWHVNRALCRVLDRQPVRLHRLQMCAARDEAHIAARMRKPSADEAADTTRSEACDSHVRLRGAFWPEAGV